MRESESVLIFDKTEAVERLPYIPITLNNGEVMIEELGSYTPAFFKMKIGVNGDIDLNKMSHKEFSVFFHEYIHFIQDFTTAAGCRRIYVYGEYIRQCVNQITSENKSDKKSFNVPILIPDFANNVLPNIQLLDKLDGDSDEVPAVSIKDITTIKEEVEYKDSVNLPFDSVVVITMDNMPISLGTYAIKESMAYLVERLCTTSYTQSPDFPYNIARLVADFLLGQNILSNMDLLALCDVALLTSNPGLSFYRFLLLMKDGTLNVNRPDDIYDYFYNNVSSMNYN